MGVQGTTTIKTGVNNPVGGQITLTAGAGATINQSGQTFTIGSSPSIGGSITGGTTGSVIFVGAGPVLAQDNSNFFWDDSANRLGIGTTGPSANLHIRNSASTNIGLMIQGAASQSTDLVQILDSVGSIRTAFDNNGFLRLNDSILTVSSGELKVISVDSAINQGSANLVSIFRGSPIINYTISQNIFTGTFFFYSNFTVENDPTVTGSLGNISVFANDATMRADTNATTADAYNCFFDLGRVSVVNAGTLALTQYNSVLCQPGTIGSGVTVTNHRGVYIRNPANSGTITTNTRLEIDDVTTGTTKLAIRVKGTSGVSRHQPKIKFGEDVSPTAQVDTTCSSSSTIGTIVKAASSQSVDLSEWQDSSGNNLFRIVSDGAVDFFSSTRTSFTNPAFGSSATLNFSSGATPVFFKSTNAINFTAAPSLGLPPFFCVFQPTITVSTTNMTVSPPAVYYSNPTLTADTVTWTGSDILGAFFDSPILGTANGGAFATLIYTSFRAAMTVNSGTVDTRRGMLIGNPIGAGTITNNYGLLIRNQTKGSTLNIPLYIEGTGSSGNRIIPKTKFGADSSPNVDVDINGAISYAKNTVSLTADNQVVTTTNISYISMSSNDAVAANRTFVLTQSTVAGHRLIIEWTGTNAGELIDDSAQSGGGNHRLSANWVPTQYDTLSLISNGTDWIEVARSTN